MATYNRDVAEAIGDLTSVVRTEVDEMLEGGIETPLEDLGLVDTRSGNARMLDLTWMRDFEVMEEWQGERNFDQAKQLFMSRVTNQKYENSVGFDIEDIEDDIGMLDPQGAAERLVQGYELRVRYDEATYFQRAFDRNMLQGSFTDPNSGATIYFGSLDGEPLLSDSHSYFKQIEFDQDAPPGQRMNVVDGGTFSNLVNTAFSEDALWTARKTFQEYVDFNGEPSAAAQPDTLVVGPELEREARQVLNRSLKSVSNAAVENETEGLFDIYVDRRLQGTIEGVSINFGGTDYTGQTVDLSNVWYLVNTSAPMQPFVRWNRTGFQFQEPVNTPDLSAENPAEGQIPYSVFKNDRVEMGGRARWGHSFGMPQAIYGSLGNTTLS